MARGVIKVALVTCKRLPEPDPDEALLASALERAGVRATLLAWDDPDAPWGEQDAAILRSTWNYYEAVERFVGWAEDAAKATRLFNPTSIVRQNARKTYLRDLEARGIDVAPTEFVARGEPRDLAELARARGWEAVVIKPVVSAGSFRTARFDAPPGADAQAFLDALVADRDAMVQRWLPSVETHGERSIVWIDGEVTHAVRKSPRFAGGVEQVSDEVPVAPEERALAERALAPFAKDLLYARVDMVRDEDGVLRVMELEMIEPSLFFSRCARENDALDRFVAGVVRRARGV
jgi:hypothetical protein